MQRRLHVREYEAMDARRAPCLLLIYGSILEFQPWFIAHVSFSDTRHGEVLFSFNDAGYIISAIYDSWYLLCYATRDAERFPRPLSNEASSHYFAAIIFHKYAIYLFIITARLFHENTAAIFEMLRDADMRPSMMKFLQEALYFEVSDGEFSHDYFVDGRVVMALFILLMIEYAAALRLEPAASIYFDIAREMVYRSFHISRFLEYFGRAHCRGEMSSSLPPSFRCRWRMWDTAIEILLCGRALRVRILSFVISRFYIFWYFDMLDAS